jgi:hypothetical protein
MYVASQHHNHFFIRKIYFFKDLSKSRATALGSTEQELIREMCKRIERSCASDLLAGQVQIGCVFVAQ